MPLELTQFDCCRTDFRYPDERFPAVACLAVAGRTAAGCGCPQGTEIPVVDTCVDQSPCEKLS